MAWGHSTVVNAWGEVVARAGAGEEVVYAEVDLESVAAVRAMVPTSTQRRADIYTLVDKERFEENNRSATRGISHLA